MSAKLIITDKDLCLTGLARAFVRIWTIIWLACRLGMLLRSSLLCLLGKTDMKVEQIAHLLHKSLQTSNSSSSSKASQLEDFNELQVQTKFHRLRVKYGTYWTSFNFWHQIFVYAVHLHQSKVRSKLACAWSYVATEIMQLYDEISKGRNVQTYFIVIYSSQNLSNA